MCTHQRLIIDATSSHVEAIDRMRSQRYRGAQAGKTFARIGFYTSDGNMREPPVIRSESARIYPVGQL
jgi:hypothetical protein